MQCAVASASRRIASTMDGADGRAGFFEPSAHRAAIDRYAQTSEPIFLTVRLRDVA
jgi:hypothetical protein